MRTVSEVLAEESDRPESDFQFDEGELDLPSWEDIEKPEDRKPSQ